MSYQFIAGRGGEGKSTRACQFILEDARIHPERAHFLVVPEQATLQSQKALCSIHPNGCVMDVDIVSFERLAFRVFKELGTDTLKVLEETGKSLILRKLIEENKESLPIIGKNVRKSGYVEEIKSMISEFSQYRISPMDLKKLTDEGRDGLFAGKLTELERIYEAFLEHIKGEYYTAELLLELFLKLIPESELLKDSVIVFDGYTGFTPVQEEIVKALLGVSKKLVFTVTIDSDTLNFNYPGEDDLFFMSKNYILGIRAFGRELKIPEEEPVNLKKTENKREKFPEVIIYESQNPRQELIELAVRIRGLMAEGVRLKNIGVICGDQNIYSPYIKEIFGDRDIPVFIDKSENAGNHPVVAFIKSLFNLMYRGFSPKDVTAYLRSGFCKIPINDIDLFENYLLATGVRGLKRYSEDFSFAPREFSGEELACINRVREEVITGIKPFLDKFKANGEYAIEDMLRELFLLLSRHNLGETLDSRNEPEVYEILLQALEKLNSLIGKEKVSPGELKNLLVSILEASRLRKLPMSQDAVVFGDLTRTRLSDIHSLFIIGANEGVLPKTETGSGFFNERDRRLLEKLNVKLAPGKRARQFAGNFYLYMVMQKPRENLFISYSLVSLGGERLAPSHVLNNFKNAKRQESVILEYADRQIGDIRLARLLRDRESGRISGENLEILSNLYGYYTRHLPEKLGEITGNVKSSIPGDALSGLVYEALRKDNLSLSTSRIESYARCAYSYYLRYFLGLKRRSINKLQRNDFGNIYHNILNNFFRLTREETTDPRSISPQQVESLLNKAVSMAYGDISKIKSLDGGVDSYIKRRVYMTIKRTVDTLLSQILGGGFLPGYFETNLREIVSPGDLRIDLESGGRVNLSGIVDRIDTGDTGENLYLKIIDYKSSVKDIDYSMAYGGLQIQLLFYMDRVRKAFGKKYPDKEVKPGALFYYHIDDPIIEAASGEADEEIDKKLKKSLLPKGLIVDDDTGKSLLTGEMGSAKEISREDLDYLMDYATTITKEIAENIRAGDVSKKPYRLGQATGCDYCDFKGMCGFDEKTGKYRDLPKISNLDEFKDRLASDGI